MRAAPSWPCHRRAVRHPVPQAPGRAFIVTRRVAESIFMAPSGLFFPNAPYTIFRVLDFSENLDRVRLLLVNIRYIT